nr:MAG TPA: hypothetical protein [Caudoviricetes sp.]
MWGIFFYLFLNFTCISKLSSILYEYRKILHITNTK